MHCFIIFPHQLYRQTSPLQEADSIVLTEEWLFFRQYAFHQRKIHLHRASMQAYRHFLQEQGLSTTYTDSLAPESDIRLLIPKLAGEGCSHITCYEPDDDWLERRLKKACSTVGITLTLLPSPGFINPSDTTLPVRKDGSLVQTDFYIQQRKQRSLLMDGKQPAGGQWTFDTENRQRYPAGQQPPALWFPETNRFTEEARNYVSTHFAGNPGRCDAATDFPVTHEDADLWLNDFLHRRFHGFGPYEDALVAREHWLHHSVITPMLNIGLLTPRQVLDAAISHAEANQVPLASLEGFVRQIAGWREFIRLMYWQHGTAQRTRNFWGFERPIPAAFYTGNTGIVPVDICIQKLLKTGYNHHIERLMVVGNFMLLCEFSPDEVYRWFMEMYADSYDWVMVPNVYGMTQFADGGMMCSKPYISGSNYLLKMGDFRPDGRWEKIWDALFWRFMHVHRDFFTQNPRLGMLVRTFDKMDPGKRQQLLQTAADYLKTLEA